MYYTSYLPVFHLPNVHVLQGQYISSQTAEEKKTFKKIMQKLLYMNHGE